MAKKLQKDFNEKSKQYREGDMILMFNLKRITDIQTPLMQEWINIDLPVFDAFEQHLFDRKLNSIVENIAGWSEQDFKMKFLAFMLDLGNLEGEEEYRIVTFFDKIISTTVEGIKLTVKSDFMMAMGVLDVLKTPYLPLWSPQMRKQHDKQKRQK